MSGGRKRENVVKRFFDGPEQIFFVPIYDFHEKEERKM